MGFPRQQEWSELPFPPPGDLPEPGLKPKSPVSHAVAGGYFNTEPPGKPRALKAGTSVYFVHYYIPSALDLRASQ